MENKSKSKNSGWVKAVFIICIVLSVIGLIATVYVCEKLSADTSYLIAGIATTVIYLGLFFYAIFGYKQPHGNFLKYIILLYGLAYGVIVGTKLTGILAIVGIVAIGMVCYIAGRLNKIKKNAVLIIIVMALVLFVGIYQICVFQKIGVLAGIGNVMYILFMLSPFFCWAGLCAAYVARYNAHKEAGLLDKNE